jgi:GNAT superfamily N-acetyltransferase
VFVKIRQLKPQEISLHRNLRLCALRDSPDSFAETAADVEARPFSYWETLTRTVTEPERHVMYLAYDDEDIFGSTYGLRSSESSDMARIGGMWVSPLQRRNGIGRALLDSVLSWSREHGFKHLSLWAPYANAAALALYHRAGFRQTRRRRPLPTNAIIETVELEMSHQPLPPSLRSGR